MLNWTDIDVTINGTGILAENASLGSNNNLISLYSLGRSRLTPQTMNGPFQGNIQIDYVLDLNNEPNQTLVNQIKNTDVNFTYAPTQIAIAGLTGYAYLENYSINISPNNVGKASASYIVFSPFSGGLSPKTGNLTYNPSGITGIAHAWTTFITTTEESINFPTYEFTYNLRANWQPVYVLGRQFPDQINLMSAEENLNITKDLYKNIKSTGQDGFELLKFPSTIVGYREDWVRGRLIQRPIIVPANISIVGIINTNIPRLSELFDNSPRITINISGMKAIDTKLSAAINDMVKVTSTIKKTY